MEIDFSSFTNFYFILYTTNPDKRRVVFELDANGIRQSLKEDKFYELVHQTCSLTLANKVKATLLNVNETYLLDKEKGTITELQNVARNKPLSDFQTYKNLIKNENTKKTDWSEKVLSTQDSWRQRLRKMFH